MSQKKVEKYKEYKKNRAQILKREKMMRRLEYIVAALICAVLVVWLAVSAVQTRKRDAEANEPEVTAVELDMNAYSDYVSGLQTSFS